MSRLLRKPGIAVLSLVGALLSGVAATKVWVSGSATDTALGAANLSGVGTSVAPAALGLALVAGAAVLAGIAAGPRARVLAFAALLASGAGIVWSAAAVVRDPEGALAPIAASALGLDGSVPVRATVQWWVWLALAGGLLLAATGVLALIAARGWGRPAARYERPASGRRGERVASDWELLTDGVDPTEDEVRERT